MKRYSLTFLAASLISFGLYAQGLSGGIKIGLNIADQSITGNNSGGVAREAKAIPGLQAGAFFTVMLTDKIGIQPELLYSMQGSKESIYSGESADLRLDYLNVPILFRYNITDMIHLHIGPQIGFLLSAKETFRGTTTDIKSDYKSTDFSLTFGEGVDLPCGLTAGLRYSLGLVTIQDGDSFYYNWVNIKNNNLQLYVGYKLLRKK